MIPGKSDVAPSIERLARVGYVAKGVLYGTIGVLAGCAATGRGGGATDTRGAMAIVLDAPFGRFLLVIIALGLVGYAAWRIAQAIADPERRGNDMKGLAMRGSYLARGVMHLILALSALKLAMGHSAGAGNSTDKAAATAFTLPGGQWLVWAIAIGIMAFGAYQIYRAAMSQLSKHLATGTMAAEAGSWVIPVSRFGIAARGLVFVAIGWLLSRAAASHDPGRAGGIGDALRSLEQLGRGPFAAIAAGLIAYGVYELLNARYRRIDAS